MATGDFTEFNLPRNAYAAFDAVSMKQLIVNRLKSSNLFPDIDYEGSNISGLVDIVAYTYHVLLFYLNQTASEAYFNQAELYENMNKIVSLLGYKPFGYQTATLNFNFAANNNLPAGFYTLSRFAYAVINNISYSFNREVSFEKTTNDYQEIESVGSSIILQQGKFIEHPLYTAIGEEYEQITIIDTPLIQTNQTKYIDNNNIFVFVKDVNTEKWSEWSEVASLYISNLKDKSFEKRLNENGRYEIKFGNDITGKKLNTGDVVAIYYLQSDGSLGSVAANALNSAPVILYNTAQYTEIVNDLKSADTNYLTMDEVRSIELSNQYASISPTEQESVSQIRNNTPTLFSTQNRAVTVADYEGIVTRSFANITTSVKVLSNKEYTSSYLRYFYNIGLDSPNSDERLLFNQVTFNDACDFNNVYIFAIPKIGAIQNETTPISLYPNQKQAIVNRFNNIKAINHNVVVSDPVYQAFDFGFDIPGENFSIDVRQSTVLRVYRSANYVISKELLKNKIAAIITSFFAQKNNTLGQLINLAELNINILGIPGVGNLQTARVYNGVEHTLPKISVLQWDPLYPNVNINVTAQNIQLEAFQFPFFYEVSNLINKIEVI